MTLNAADGTYAGFGAHVVGVHGVAFAFKDEQVRARGAPGDVAVGLNGAVFALGVVRSETGGAPGGVGFGVCCIVLVSVLASTSSLGVLCFMFALNLSLSSYLNSLSPVFADTSRSTSCSAWSTCSMDCSSTMRRSGASPVVVKNYKMHRTKGHVVFHESVQTTIHELEVFVCVGWGRVQSVNIVSV